MSEGYGRFDLTIGVPDDYDGHRCEYAREYLREHLGDGLVEALVIQRTVPADPPGGDSTKEYYRVGGNIRMKRVLDE